LAAEVARLFGRHQGKYRSPRITAAPRDARWRVTYQETGPFCASIARAGKDQGKTVLPGGCSDPDRAQAQAELQRAAQLGRLGARRPREEPITEGDVVMFGLAVALVPSGNVTGTVRA
jgi:hypothetical protein